MRQPVPALLAAAALLGGCGDDNGAGAPKISTTDAGTVIVGATDRGSGLKLEVQDDNLYVRLAGDASEASRKLTGKTLGGACEVDGAGGVRVARQFPIYWRGDSKDWGSAVIRDPIGGGGEGAPVLAQHVTRCRIFEGKPTGVPDQSAFNEATDTPVATVKLR